MTENEVVAIVKQLNHHPLFDRVCQEGCGVYMPVDDSSAEAMFSECINVAKQQQYVTLALMRGFATFLDGTEDVSTLLTEHLKNPKTEVVVDNDGRIMTKLYREA